MLPPMKPKRPRIAIVGAGNLGSALAVSLHAAGFVVSEILSREGKFSRKRARALAHKVGARPATVDSPATADLVWLCVPDRDISSCARALGQVGSWQKKIAVHSSGALSSDEIAILRERGASIASAHPLMTFVQGVRPSLIGVSFAVEGDASALRIVRKVIADLGAQSFPIRKRDKAAYHAWGTFASPLLTALLAISERVAQTAGVRAQEARRRMLPIIRQTVENYAQQGPARGFSGPIIRGDAETVARHLEVMRKMPEAREVYRTLALAALGTLPVKNRKQLKVLLRDARG
jgi:predicted short-subunit dehydrogenase-like oxidoreductase (DUF2520 family)